MTATPAARLSPATRAQVAAPDWPAAAYTRGRSQGHRRARCRLCRCRTRMAMGAAEESVRRVGKGGSSSSSTKGKWKKGGFGWGSLLRPRGNGGAGRRMFCNPPLRCHACGLSSSGRVTWAGLPSGTGLQGVLISSWPTQGTNGQYRPF